MKKQHVRNSASQNDPEKARAYAFLLLKFRLRSESELLSRLKQKGFSDSIAKDTVGFLKDKEFINDQVFARGWVSARLKRPFGLRRIKQELVVKGLDKEVIEDSLEQAEGCYDENKIVSQMARQRFSRLTGLEPKKAKARVYGYLLRRGFSPDVINDVFRNKGDGSIFSSSG